MLSSNDIHNSAILRPRYVKCPSMQQFGRHAFAKLKNKNYEQCVDCGKIKPKGA